MTKPVTKQKEGKKEPAWKAYTFLLVVVIIYLIVFFLDPDKTAGAFQFSLNMLHKLVPILAVVSGFMFLNNLLVKPSWVKNHVGDDSGWKGMFIAVVGGTLSMGPIYVWYGVLEELQKKGMRTSLIASFLYARSVKPQLLPLMVYYFGWIYALVLVIYLVIFSVLNGILLEKISAPARNDIK